MYLQGFVILVSILHLVIHHVHHAPTTLISHHMEVRTALIVLWALFLLMAVFLVQIVQVCV